MDTTEHITTIRRFIARCERANLNPELGKPAVRKIAKDALACNVLSENEFADVAMVLKDRSQCAEDALGTLRDMLVTAEWAATTPAKETTLPPAPVMPHPDHAAFNAYLDALQIAGFIPSHVDNGGEYMATPDRAAVLSEALASDEASIKFPDPLNPALSRWLHITLGNLPSEIVDNYGCWSTPSFEVFEGAINSISDAFSSNGQ